MISEELLENVYNSIDEKQNIPKLITGNKQKTGKLIDGKEEFCEIINVGSCPNNSSITIDYTTNDKVIHDFYLIGKSNSFEYLKVPNAASSSNYFNIFFSSDGKLQISTNQDRSRFIGTVYIFFTYI